MPALISATVSSSPPRNFSSSSSSVSATASRSSARYLSAFSTRSAGMSSTSYFSPRAVSPRQTRARMVTRSTTPMKSFSEPIGQLDDQRLGLEAVHDGVDREVEVRAELVHLVDEADARDVVLVGLTPDGLRLGLDALLAVEDGDGTVEDAQRALDLDREVHVARGVDDVDLVVVPVAGRRGGRDRDAALLLLLHPVHRRRAVVRLTDLVVDPGVEQDPLGGRRLAGIDVSHDADVADLREVRQHIQCHVSCPLSVGLGGATGPARGSDRRRSARECRDYQR